MEPGRPAQLGQPAQPGQQAGGDQVGHQPAGQQPQSGPQLEQQMPSPLVLAQTIDLLRRQGEQQQLTMHQQSAENQQLRETVNTVLSSLPQLQSLAQQPSHAPSHNQSQQQSQEQPSSSTQQQLQPGEPQFLTGNTKLPTLHSHNWETWRVELESLLVQHNLFHAIYPTPSAPPSQRASHLAQSLLVSNIDQHLRPLVLDASSAQEAYQRLRGHFGKQLRFQVPLLERQLHTLHIQQQESMLAYLQRSRNLRRDLLHSGRPELASTVASHMLSGLPDSKYGMVKEHLWLQGITELEEIASFLQLKEQRLQLGAQQQRQQLSQAAAAAPARAPSRGIVSRGVVVAQQEVAAQQEAAAQQRPTLQLLASKRLQQHPRPQAPMGSSSRVWCA